MKPVEPNDQLFLVLERRQQPMHVGGLQLFSLPEDAGPNFLSDLFARTRAHRRPSSPFNKRLVSRFGLSFWEEDSELDIDLHLRHWAIPQPGRVRELLSLVSAQHSVSLSRERPLWEVHLIEGLADRRFAVYIKTHHALMDGISMMRLAMQSLSPDPANSDMPPPWGQPRRRRSREADVSIDYYVETTRKYLSAMPAVVRHALELSVKAHRDAEGVSMFGAPRSMLNQKISGSRRVAAQSYSLSRFKAIAKSLNATVNDVVLCVCGSALRRYLLAQNALPERPLIAMVPMSIRKDDSAGGNQIAMILANLATHLTDPLQRLRVVKHSVEQGKARYHQMSREESTSFSCMMLAPVIYSLVTGLAPRWLSFNVVISNVPGPRQPQFWNGARLEGMYPLSLVLDHHSLNITLTSYCDSLEFGLVACRRSLPSMQRLLHYIEHGVMELEQSAGLRAARNGTRARPDLLAT